MKKTILLIAIPIIVILCSVCGLLITNNTTIKNIKIANSEYEYYLDKTIYGTELATLINKAVNENEQNKIEKDEKNNYIENDTNSIEIEVEMLITEKKYKMETFYNNDITKFVENYNLIKFKCKNIEYHKKNGRVKKLVFVEIEE